MGILKSVLVTGGTGYLGSWISRHLSECGYSVSSFCRTIPQNFESYLPGVSLIQGDLTNADCLKKLFARSFDAIVHTVSLDHRQSETFEVDFVNRVNVSLTWQLLDHFSKETKKFIYLSTQQVMGSNPPNPICEDFIGLPTNRYGLTHAIGEQLCSFYDSNSSMDCVSLRLSNGYGAPVFHNNNWNWLVINDLTAMAYHKSKLVLNSDGSPMKDFIHVNDIARVVEHFLEKSSEFSSYNVASGYPTSLLLVAHAISDIFFRRFGKRVPVYHSGSIHSVRTYEYSNQGKLVDNSRLLESGFNFETTLEDGINGLIDYFESKSNVSSN